MTGSRPTGPAERESLSAVVHHILDVLGRGREVLESAVARRVIDQLRYSAHDATDPALRAAVHVACAHLSAGNLEEARDALGTAAALLDRPHH